MPGCKIKKEKKMLASARGFSLSARSSKPLGESTLAWESAWVKVHKSFSRQKVECPQLFYSNTSLCMWIFRIFHLSYNVLASV